ncbi:F0F1 ATP synthase subunit A [Peptoniphilus sp. KCTC 25270]|uniref:F0F1 ATP synthase subunit A n=1 Tax=Peptoniphilus sp. KCTC 25270 TaxID=2897414 RepID=UPI001E5B8983|nr:F0F1 ATP synthase subunit A [Peptoniphilus sp. KCTC 25270]MCD1147582.1 F0F1 ATP synthase subunit A [Peptoniphilus sp. KCTC 25270]
MKRGIILHLANKEIWLHESIFTTYLLLVIITIGSIIISKKIKQADVHEKPKGVVHLVEIVVEAINGLVIQAMGERNLGFAPYMLTIGVFLAFANLSGLVGLVPPTSDYNVTLALALITFVLIHFFSVRTKGIGGYLKQYAEPLPLLLPINVLGEIANPISLSFRLFGNILSGALIMGLVYSGLSQISKILIPFVAWPLHAYFDVFSGALQTFIFIMLSMTYINSNMADEEEIAARKAKKQGK